MLASLLAAFFFLIFFASFFYLVFFLLDNLDRQLDLVRLFVRVEVDEGLDIAVHDGGAGLDKVLLFELLAGILTPFNGLFLLVLVVVGKVKNIGALELEPAYFT